MKDYILKGIVNQIKEDIGLGMDLSRYSIFEVDFNIIGSENNPHIIMEDGLIFNKNGEIITSADLRYLLYNGVERDEEYIKRLVEKTRAAR